MPEKIFCGSGKEFGNYEQLNLNVCISNIPNEFINEYQGKKYTNLTVTRRREPDDKGKTHYIEVNTFKPTQQNEETKPETAEEVAAEEAFSDDVPF